MLSTKSSMQRWEWVKRIGSAALTRRAVTGHTFVRRSYTVSTTSEETTHSRVSEASTTNEVDEFRNSTTFEDSATLDRSIESPRFYSKAMNDIRIHQGLSPIPDRRPSKDDFIAYHEATLKDPYDLRGVLSRLKTILDMLDKITPKDGPFTSSIPPFDPEKHRVVHSLDQMPQIPPEFTSPEVLINYLREITSKKYTPAMKKKRHMDSLLIQDLMRLNSPDTENVRSVEAYNLCILYFIRSKNFRAARILMEQLKLEHSIRPNTETYNIFMSSTHLSLSGSKAEYKRYFFNFHERANQRRLALNAGDTTHFSLTEVASKKSLIYFQHPLEFLTKYLQDMLANNVQADAQTWNIVLSCARGLVAKSHVLELMHDHDIQMTTTGLNSVVTDAADFLGPHKAIELIKDRNCPITDKTVLIVIERLIDVPSQKNIDAAWGFVVSVSQGTHSETHQRITPTTRVLNTFAERFQRAGRADWIFGIMAAMKKNWNVEPDYTTFGHLLGACVRNTPHQNKLGLLRCIYMHMVQHARNQGQSQEDVEDHTSMVFPNSVRYWMRRANHQCQFLANMQKKFRAPMYGEEVREMKLVMAQEQKSPFEVNMSEYPGSEDALKDAQFWELAHRVFEWPLTGPLPLRHPKYYLSEDVVKALTLLGIRKYWRSAYTYSKEFEAAPRDQFKYFAKEWREFRAQQQEAFRNMEDKKERARRKKFTRDPYDAYLDELRDEFDLV